MDVIASPGDFANGFNFAIIVMQSLGNDIDFNQIVSQLEEVKAKTVTLVPNPAELPVNHTSVDLPVNLRAMIDDFAANRKPLDDANAVKAKCILDFMAMTMTQMSQ